MTKINLTITATDDNNLVLEARGRTQISKVIPRDDNAGKALLDAVEAAISANERPVRQQPAAPAPAMPKQTPDAD